MSVPIPGISLLSHDVRGTIISCLSKKSYSVAKVNVANETVETGLGRFVNAGNCLLTMLVNTFLPFHLFYRI